MRAILKDIVPKYTTIWARSTKKLGKLIHQYPEVELSDTEKDQLKFYIRSGATADQIRTMIKYSFTGHEQMIDEITEWYMAGLDPRPYLQNHDFRSNDSMAILRMGLLMGKDFGDRCSWTEIDNTVLHDIASAAYTCCEFPDAYHLFDPAVYLGDWSHDLTQRILEDCRKDSLDDKEEVA